MAMLESPEGGRRWRIRSRARSGRSRIVIWSSAGEGGSGLVVGWRVLVKRRFLERWKESKVLVSDAHGGRDKDLDKKKKERQEMRK